MKKSSISLIIATWFWSGLIPPILLKGMAGTYGSFFALPLCILAISLAKTASSPNLLIYFGIVLIIFLAGMYTVRKAEDALGPQTDWKGRTKTRDQNQIVIDEVLGMLFACMPILFVAHPSVIHYASAFILFRFFDIVKIPPIKYFDGIKNVFGVMFDDVGAGAYAAVVLQILIPLF